MTLALGQGGTGPPSHGQRGCTRAPANEAQPWAVERCLRARTHLRVRAWSTAVDQGHPLLHLLDQPRSCMFPRAGRTRFFLAHLPILTHTRTHPSCLRQSSAVAGGAGKARAIISQEHTLFVASQRGALLRRRRGRTMAAAAASTGPACKGPKAWQAGGFSLSVRPRPRVNTHAFDLRGPGSPHDIRGPACTLHWTAH